MKPQGVIIHHSLTKDGIVADYDAFKKYHMEVQGWSNIGYHAVVERVGNKLVTQTGRGINELGAHCVGKNDYLGICLAGNFDLAPPDAEALEYLASVTANYLWIGSYYGGVFYWQGELDEIRITKDVCRHVSNFTPPTVAYPNH